VPGAVGHAAIVSRARPAVTGRLGGAPRARYVASVRASRPALLVLIALSSACLWRSYGEVLRVHLEVLSSFTDKAIANAASGQRPTSADVTELTYPLQRARQFAYQYRGYAERGSYARFGVALDRYQTLVDAIDAARGDAARWDAERTLLPAQAAAFRQAAEDVRTALANER
jgi:hypothetical protein